MSENEDTRKILHRIVFYDLLSTPDIEHQRDTYGKIHEAHLSIPLMPGLETVWAPNGYGKTFAMQMLERMWKPTQFSSDQWTTRGGVHWLSDFLRECQAMVLDISDSPSSEKIRESSFHDVATLSENDWTPEGVQRMVPFSLMMARIVELDVNDQILEIHDLWIKPNWKNFVTHDIEVEVSRLPIFANYESKISELLQDGDAHDKYLLDQLDYLDEEARFFIMERDSWEKESSLLKKAGLDISKFIEETENEYLNPVIPPTFNWNSEPDMDQLMYPLSSGSPGTDEFHVEPYQSGYFDDGEWKSGDSTRDRRPPVPFEIAKGSSIQLEMSPRTSDLLEVLRTTKIDYVEIPKESLDFFEDQDRATEKVTEIINQLDASRIQMIEDKINDVLRMRGDTDPWSRKVSLSDTTILQKPTPVPKIWGRVDGLAHHRFAEKEARIVQLQWKGRLPKSHHLEIGDFGMPKFLHTGRIYVRVPSNRRNLDRCIEKTEFEIQVITKAVLDWTAVLQKAETNLVESENYIITSTREFRSQLKETNNEAQRNKLEAKFRKFHQKIERNFRDIKEQLPLVAEIVNDLRLCLAFYEEGYLILKMFELAEPESDVRYNSLDFVHTQLSHLGQSWSWGIEQETLEQYQVLPKYRKKTMFEAYMSELNKMKDFLEKIRETRFEVESPYRNTPLRKDVLSFGQKSTILTELYLGTFEALSDPSSDIDEGSFNENRYCLIIDEPEVGRSEYSLDHLIKRLIWSKGAHDAELKNSVVVLSHRNKLLKQVSGKYHLLQPVDIGYQTEEEEE